MAAKGGEPLAGANAVVPVIGKMEAALDSLALAATNDKAVVQQLTAANLALTNTVVTLTAAIKKLVEAAAKKKGTVASMSTPGRVPGANATYPGNYCWTHRHRVSKGHTSETCSNKAEGHKNNATAADTKGGSKNNKGWDKA